MNFIDYFVDFSLKKGVSLNQHLSNNIVPLVTDCPADILHELLVHVSRLASRFL